MSWQPIETAPRDGTKILVAFNSGFLDIAWWNHTVRTTNGKVTYEDASWSLRSSRMFSLVGGPVEPAHWMPLPEAPNA